MEELPFPSSSSSDSYFAFFLVFSSRTRSTAFFWYSSRSHFLRWSSGRIDILVENGEKITQEQQKWQTITIDTAFLQSSQCDRVLSTALLSNTRVERFVNNPRIFQFISVISIRMGRNGKSKLGKRKRETLQIVKKDVEAEPLPQSRPSDEPAPKKVIFRLPRI